MSDIDNYSGKPEGSAPDPAPHRRRKRYGGTHPKKFAERYKELNSAEHPEMVEHIRAQGRTPAGTHVPIMVAEVMACLAPRAGEVVADGTLGYGGHAAEFLKRIGPTGRLVGFDVDRVQLERTVRRLAELGYSAEQGYRVSPHHGNFAGLDRALAAEGLEGYDIIFADLGVSSMQIDDPARGFSYKHEGPLDMRMDSRLKRSAADLVNAMTEEELAEALREFADEPEAARIAEAVVRARGRRPITTTTELVDAIFAARRMTRQDWRRSGAAERGEVHPAARTFQALRILVNDELASLQQLLRAAPWSLRSGGRIGILSFHSGEDRLVKQAFQAGRQSGVYAEVAEEVLRPTSAELHDNPRASAAKFRWARKA